MSGKAKKTSKMKTFEVTATVTGRATVTVEAPDEETARREWLSRAQGDGQLIEWEFDELRSIKEEGT